MRAAPSCWLALELVGLQCGSGRGRLPSALPLVAAQHNIQAATAPLTAVSPADSIGPGHFLRQGASHEGAEVTFKRLACRDTFSGCIVRAHSALPSLPRCSTRAATPVLNIQQAREIASITKQALLSGQYEFVRCNFANPGRTRGRQLTQPGLRFCFVLGFLRCVIWSKSPLPVACALRM